MIQTETELHSEGGIEGIGVVKPETENEGLTFDKYGKDEILVLETVNYVGKIQSADPIVSSVQHPGLAVDHHISEELMSSQDRSRSSLLLNSAKQRLREQLVRRSGTCWSQSKEELKTRLGPELDL